MPAQHETQADAITRLIETIARFHAERDVQTTAIARLLDDNNALAAKLARLQEAAGRLVSEFHAHDNVTETDAERLHSAWVASHE